VTTTAAQVTSKSAPAGRAIPPGDAVARRPTARHDKAKRSNRSAAVEAAVLGKEPQLDPARGGALFGHAWSLLRSGDAKAAAAEFAEAEGVARGQDIEEDALYWRAVATARAGDSVGARGLFNAFLERFPRSSRAAEAAAAVGWLLLDGGETRAARRAFERAALDPSPAVRASAQEGLRRTADQD
jgi:TolA-binding protein